LAVLFYWRLAGESSFFVLRLSSGVSGGHVHILSVFIIHNLQYLYYIFHAPHSPPPFSKAQPLTRLHLVRWFEWRMAEDEVDFSKLPLEERCVHKVSEEIVKRDWHFFTAYQKSETLIPINQDKYRALGFPLNTVQTNYWFLHSL
jgi:hypothetical protein